MMLKATKGKVIHGGKTEKEQLFIQPTVIEVDEADSTMQSEVFGPILPVLQLPSLDDAIKFIKRREKPLISYFFSESKKSIERFQNDITSGTLLINDVIMNVGCLCLIPFTCVFSQMQLDSLPFG